MLNSFKPLLKLLLIVAPFLAVLLLIAIISTNRNKSSAPNTTNTQEQVSTQLPTVTQIPGSGPTESGCPQEGHIKSPSSFNKANITFDNQTAGNLKVYWIDFQGNRKFYSNLKAHSKYDQATWVGHVWVVANAADQCIKLHSANAVKQILVID